MASEKISAAITGPFATTFQGTIWNTLAHPTEAVLFLEVRDEKARGVSFAAVDVVSGSVLFREISFEESWWLSLADVSGDMVFLTHFPDGADPARKNLIAFNFRSRQIAWFRNNFSISEAGRNEVLGHETNIALKKVLLDVMTGSEIRDDKSFVPLARNFIVKRPLQYYAGSGHFETVRSFLAAKCKVSAISLVEYLELDRHLIVSFYTMEKELANFLLVTSHTGETILMERVAGGLKGFGVDTFFVFSESLIFVRSNRELVIYKMV